MSNEFAAFGQQLKRVANNLEPMRAKRLRRVTKGAADMARSVAPTESGALAAGIHVVRRDDGAMAVETAKDTYWGHFQEHGTSVMAPNPFMGPAVERWGPKLVDELEGMADEIGRDLS